MSSGHDPLAVVGWHHGQGLDFLGSLLGPSPPSDLTANRDSGESGPSQRGRSPSPAVIDWALVAELAERHQLLPAVWLAASEASLLEPVPRPLLEPLGRDGPGPHHVAATLELAWLDNQRRMADLLAQLTDVTAALEAAGIVSIALKGAAMCARSVYANPATRIMRDVDLLIAGDRAQAARDVLLRGGYVDYGRACDGASWRHHLAPLRDPSRFGSIELHVAPIGVGWAEALPAEEMWALAESFQFRGARVRVPSTEHLIVHALVHGYEADEHWIRHSIDLRTELELALLADRAGEPDWPAVRGHLDRVGRGRLVDLHLANRRRLFGLEAQRGAGGRRAALWRAGTELLYRFPDARPVAERASRLAHAFDAGRLRRHYGPDSPLTLRRRHAVRVLRRLAPTTRRGR